jgi:two-component system nitrogen regulation response regulator GlnG
MMKKRQGQMAEGARVWIVDDDEAIRFVLERSLTRAGYSIRVFDRVADVCKTLSSESPDAIITDIRLPDDDGLRVLDALAEVGKQVPVIAITGYSDLDQAVSAFQQGVFDYLPKPFDLDQVLSVLASAVAGHSKASPGDSRPEEGSMIGDSAPMQEVFRTIGRLSRSSISVLITGETGTGKEVVAHALHRHSPRSGAPFVAINTAAIPSELLESELFGHERGSFTGAHARRQGRFEEAEGGTLFLDEIGDMPLSLQTRLLRVLAEKDYYRIGGRDLLRADVRVIAATHQNLEARVASGAFREDLYHRLNVISIALPPLRDRPGDVAALAEHFLHQAADDMSLEIKRLRPETLEILAAHPWPGNVRQLQNLCRQLCVMAPGKQVFPEDLPGELLTGAIQQGQASWQGLLREWSRAALNSGQPDLMAAVRKDMENVLFQEALEHSGGKRIEAARLLGVGRNTLTRKLKEGGG